MKSLRTIASLCAIGCAVAAYSQDCSKPSCECDLTPKAEEQPALFRLDATARMDWQLDRTNSETDESATGFKGKYLMFRMDGRIGKNFTYSWRQRLNKAIISNSWFEATDWIYADYAVNGWNFRAGKDVVAIGGWEYDAAPYNIFDGSVFWNNIACYQLGVSARYSLSQNDRLTLQITQSPMHTQAFSNLYAYNLMWNGHHGCFDAIYSANLIEYAKGKYINYLMLGNKFSFGKLTAEIDLMNRAASGQSFLFKDCSVVGEIGYLPEKHIRVFGKYTYDVNKTGTNADAVVLDNTELNMAGAGVEYYPLCKDKTSLRLHLVGFYSWGKNGNTADLMQNNTFFLSAGVTWNMNIVSKK